MADTLLESGHVIAAGPSLSLSESAKRKPNVQNHWTISAILSVVLCVPLGMAAVIFIPLYCLSLLFQRAFKAVLRLIDDKSFELAVVVITTLVGYFQLPLTPFIVYASFVTFLLILKWLRGSECGMLKDKVCHLIYKLDQQWIFRNWSVVGIKLHGCHPVTKCVFESGGFLFHEGTEINPEIGWEDEGIWNPLVPKDGEDESFDELMAGYFICVDFPVKKGPLDMGDRHVYRISMRYKDGLLRYNVDYFELYGDPSTKEEWRGGTDDFLIAMEKECATRFYQYIRKLESGTALISVMDDMCHCEKMLAVAKLIKKGEKLYQGKFITIDGVFIMRVFCGVDGFKALLKSVHW